MSSLISRIKYCEDKRWICPHCENDISESVKKHCSNDITPKWAGCYCCDEKQCCNYDRCTCNFQHLTKDPIYGYLPKKRKNK